MNGKRVLTAGVMTLALGGVAAAVPAAAANPRPPQVGAMNQDVYVDSKAPNAAWVKATFRCYGGGKGVVWSSVKQSDKPYDPALTEGGSSSVAKAWADSHIQVPCDGAWHTASFKMDQHATDFSGRSLRKLKNGSAWLQFCLTDASERLATNDQWEQVHGAVGHI